LFDTEQAFFFTDYETKQKFDKFTIDDFTDFVFQKFEEHLKFLKSTVGKSDLSIIQFLKDRFNIHSEDGADYPLTIFADLRTLQLLEIYDFYENTPALCTLKSDIWFRAVLLLNKFKIRLF